MDKQGSIFSNSNSIISKPKIETLEIANLSNHFKNFKESEILLIQNETESTVEIDILSSFCEKSKVDVSCNCGYLFCSCSNKKSLF